jgi:hypothetical protein
MDKIFELVVNIPTLAITALSPRPQLFHFELELLVVKEQNLYIVADQVPRIQSIRAN